MFLSWQDPLEFTTGVAQDITHYSVSVSGDAVQIIPATTVCPTVNCSYLFPLHAETLPITSFRGDVSANNVIGPGPSCPIQMEVGEYIHHDLHYLIRSINNIYVFNILQI